MGRFTRIAAPGAGRALPAAGGAIVDFVSRREVVLGDKWTAVLAAADAHRAEAISLVGSTARGEDRPDSDVDFLVDFAPGASLFDQAGLQAALGELLGCPVDVISRGSLSADRVARVDAALPVSAAERDVERLGRIGDDAGLLGDVVAEGPDVFAANATSRLAVERLLERIGTAAAAFSEGFVTARPRLELFGSAALGAFAAASYEEASADVVWALAAAVVPAFVRVLAEDPPLGDPAWFPPGGPHPATASPTRHLSRPPAAIPDGLLDRSLPKPSGVVALPSSLARSGRGSYDFTDRYQRRRAYQVVMTDGRDADVLRYVDVDDLVDVWAELLLSSHIRIPWQRWLRATGLLGLRALIGGTVADITGKYPPRFMAR